MLNACLEYLCHRMNQSAKASFDLEENIVMVSPPSGNNGNGIADSQNKIIIFISNLEKDTYSKQQNQYSQPLQRSALTNKPLYIAISIVVAANFTNENYADGLKLLSHFLAFFHRNPLFNRQNSPDLPEFIEQISMEMEILPDGYLTHMWGMLGSHYLPSGIYRIRAAIPDSETILTQTSQLNIVKPLIRQKDN